MWLTAVLPINPGQQPDLRRMLLHRSAVTMADDLIAPTLPRSELIIRIRVFSTAGHVMGVGSDGNEPGSRSLRFKSSQQFISSRYSVGALLELFHGWAFVFQAACDR